MPIRLTREERLNRLVKKARQRVNQTPIGTSSVRQLPSSKLGVLVREAGYERASDKLLKQIRDSLVDEGIEVTPDLTDPANTPDTSVYFYDRKRRVKHLQPSRYLFKRESELSRFLFLNTEFLKYATDKHLRIREREARIANGLRLDFLAVDTKTGDLVGIELKAEEADQGIVAQAGKYMKALKAQAEAEGRRGARLVIITGQPDEELAEQVDVQAQHIGVSADWLLYRVRFELDPS